jgi:hypothetical protein
MSDDILTPPGTPPEGTPPPEEGTPPPEGTPPAPPPEETFTFSQKALKKRLNREKESAQKEMLETLGFKTLDEFSAWRKEDKKAKAAAEAKRREEMTEIERYKADLAAANEARTNYEQQLENAKIQQQAAQIDAQINAVCAKKGIKDLEYAKFKIQQGVENLGDDDELDFDTYLDELLEDDRQKISLGFVDPKILPANTLPGDDPPPTPGTPNVGKKDAMQMSKEEFQEHLRTKGLV